MSEKSHIEWTDATWNPTTGCTRVSPGCDHCYIERTPPFRREGRKFDKPGVGGSTGVRLHPERLEQPLHWRKPRRVFVNSLSDLFHDEITDWFIADVFTRMAVARRHTFQVLTKRPRRMATLLNKQTFWNVVAEGATDLLASKGPYERWQIEIDRTWDPIPHKGSNIWHPPRPLPNVWLGVSVENQEWADRRIPLLLETPAAVRFLSCEPLLGPIELVRCPWCGWPNSAETNELDRPDEPEWRLRNPLRCSACGEAGGREDWSWLEHDVPIDWVIVGGESGPEARPMHPDWARSLRDQCQAAGVPFFFKQWGEFYPGIEHGLGRQIELEDGTPMIRVGKKAAGRHLDGRTWDEYPEVKLAQPENLV